MKRIAVIGATGMLGIPVARALRAAGFAVRALVRRPEAARRVLPEGVEIVEADVRDEESLRRGLAGMDAVHLSLSIVPGAPRGEFHTEAQGLVLILAAAKAAGIKRIGYVSALVQNSEGGAWWVRDVWHQALLRIKTSRIPYAIFYTSNLMETLPKRHAAGRFLLMPAGALYPNYWIAGADFGAQVARAYDRPDGESREYFMQGPEPLTYDEAAKRFAAAKGLRVVPVPLRLLGAAGIVSPALAFNAAMMRTVLRYPEEFKATETWELLGRPTLTLEDFARSL